MKRTTLLIIVGIGLLSLTPLWWFRDGSVLLGHDSGFRLNDWSYYRSLFYSWNPSFNFGIDWALYRGFLMLQLPEMLFSVIGGGWQVGQKMTFVYWFFLMGISMFVFLKRIFPEKKHIVLWLWGSVFYMFNFYILQAWFIAERAKFSLYAALPLTVLLFWEVFFRNYSYIRASLLFGLLYFILNGGGSPPLYGATVVLWVIAFIFFGFYRILKDGQKGLVFTGKVLVAFVASFTLLNSYWIVPQIDLYRHAYASAVAGSGGIEGLISWENMISKYASIPNLLRLQGIPDWYDNPTHPFARTYLTDKFFIAGSWLPVALILAGLVFGKRQEPKQRTLLIRFVWILLVVGLVASGGSHPPFGIVYTYFMRHIPGFAIFRSSFYKFAPMVWFSVIFLSGYYLTEIAARLSKSQKAAVFTGIAGVLFLLWYHQPYFTTDFFRFYPGYSTRIHLPSYVGSAAQKANAITDSDDRILMLPQLHSVYYNEPLDSYDWGYFSIDLLPRNSIDRSIIANDRHANEAIFATYKALFKTGSQDFAKALESVSITHILWREDASYPRSILPSQSKAVQKNLLSTLGYPLSYSDGPWSLYSVRSSQTTPMISAVDGAHSAGDLPDGFAYVLSAGKKGTLVQFSGVKNKSPWDRVEQGFVTEAVCSFCETDAFEKTVQGIPIITLPKILPELKLFRLLRPQRSDNFDQMISKANTRLAVVLFDRDIQLLSKETASREYQDAMSSAEKDLTKLEGRTRNVYVIRYLLFLTAHKQALQKKHDTYSVGLETFITDKIASWQPLMWVSDREYYRFEMDLTDEGSYEVQFGGSPAPLEIDGVRISDAGHINLKGGYHRIQMPRTTDPLLFFVTGNTHVSPETTLPDTSYNRINPTSYKVHVTRAAGPFILQFNQGFSRSWKASIRRMTIPEDYHGQVNGFANGWLIDEKGDFDVEIYYAPQYIFYWGAGITLASLCVATIVLWAYRRRTI